MDASLKINGWFLSSSGLEQCKDGLVNPTVDTLMQRALDSELSWYDNMSGDSQRLAALPLCLGALKNIQAFKIDLKQIGDKNLQEDLGRGKTDSIQGPYVLQIQKVRNVSAPKATEDTYHGPQLLKVQLTDRANTHFALLLNSIPKISLDTPPGTKLKITDSVKFSQGFFLLNQQNTKVLGGCVDELVEKWKLAKSLAKHTRSVTGEGGPPPWIPFGQRNRYGSRHDHGDVKKSLETKQKDPSESDKMFEEQRKAAIQELGQHQSKKFGGGKAVPSIASTKSRDNHSNKPSPSENTSQGHSGNKGNTGQAIYRDLSYESNKPDEKSVQQLLNMGFSRDAAVNALKRNAGDLNAAVDSLVGGGGGTSGPGSTGPGSSGQRTSGPSQRGPRGGRQPPSSRDRKDEEDFPSQPSAPSTLFDFVESKLGKKPGKENDSQKSFESRDYSQEQPSSFRESGIKFAHGKDSGRRPNGRENRSSFDRQGGQDSRYDIDRQRGRDNRYDNDRSSEGRRNQNGPRDREDLRNAREDRRGSARKTDSRGQGDKRKDQRGSERESRSSDYESRGSDRERDHRGPVRNSERRNNPPPHQRNTNYTLPPRFQRKQESENNKRTDRHEHNERSERTEKRSDREDAKYERNGRADFNDHRDRGGKSNAKYHNNNNVKMSVESSIPNDEDHINNLQQLSIYEQNHTQQQPLLPPPPPVQWTIGDVCLAKYWEDSQYYHASIIAMHPTGRTCVVYFIEYGNQEEVLTSDIKPLQQQQSWGGVINSLPHMPPELLKPQGGMMPAHLGPYQLDPRQPHDRRYHQQPPEFYPSQR